jgi:LPS O-antigen subunit length determinant protein (WzzB/FepE family)
MEIEEEAVSLMDLMIVMAENIKLLVMGPLLAGLVALGVGFAMEKSFTSEAILSIPQPTATTSIPTSAQAVTMMTSPLVLDPVIRSLNLTQGRSPEAARKELASQIKATVGKDGLVRLNATAKSPQDAQNLSNAVIDAWLKTTLPMPQDRADLEQRLSYAQTSLASVRGLLARLTAESTANLAKPLTRGEAGVSLIAVGELQARYLAEVLSIPRTLQGLTRDVVVQPPTLPIDAVAPKKSLMAILAALGSGFALLLWVFARKAWTGASVDPLAADKQSRFRKLLGFSS